MAHSGKTEIAPQGSVSSFDSIFKTRPLETKENQSLQNLLVEDFFSGAVAENQIKKDLAELKRLTAEIRAINRQAVLLLGERVYRAREMLKPYKDGTFTAWLEATFGARKSGYNVLAYYELYSQLPKPELQEKMKKIPQRAAYVLASRDGDVERKAEIIRDYYEMNHADLVTLIQERFPIPTKDKRSKKSPNDKLVETLCATAKQICARFDSMSDDNKRDIIKALNFLKTDLF